MHWYVTETQKGMTFDPSTGAVTEITAAAPPSPRSETNGLWAAGRFWVWGGLVWDASDLLGDGATWDGAGSWTPLPQAGAPSPRAYASVVDAVDMVIVRGGTTGISPDPPTPGAIWKASTNTWSPMTTVGAPNDALEALSTWTGHEMLVLGSGSKVPGGIYDPGQDSWRSITTVGAPDPSYAAGAWTGSRWLVVGKTKGDDPTLTVNAYDPVADQWTSLSSAGALPSPAKYSGLSVHWTGAQLVVVNYESGPSGELVGFYAPEQDQWALATTAGQPAFEVLSCSAWDGQRLLAWGARSFLLDSGNYEDWTEVWAYQPSTTP